MKAKRILLLTAALMLALFLSGCMQTVVSLDIKEDMSADVSIKMGIDEAYYNMAGGDSVFSNVNKGEAEGFTVSPYSEDGYKGYESKGTVKDITAGQSSILENLFGPDFIRIETAEDGSRTLDFRAPVSGIENQMAMQSGYSMSELLSSGNPDMRVIITFPFDVEESNATGVSGNTLTWDLFKFEETDMYAHAVLNVFTFPVWIIIVIIAAAAAAAVFVFFWFRKKKQAAPQYGYYGRYSGPGYSKPEYSESGFSRPDHIEQGYNGPDYSESGLPEPVSTDNNAGENGLPLLFCPRCGRKLNDGMTFCPECGHKLR